VRLISRLVGLALVILAAFWFAAANADELVLIDLVLVRIRASLPLVVFGSVLVGMGVSFLVAWRANRREAGPAGIRGRRRRSLLRDVPAPPFDSAGPERDRRDPEPVDRQRPEPVALREREPLDLGDPEPTDR
jgi:hypothetical protein